MYYDFEVRARVGSMARLARFRAETINEQASENQLQALCDINTTKQLNLAILRTILRQESKERTQKLRTD